MTVLLYDEYIVVWLTTLLILDGTFSRPPERVDV